MFLQIFYTVLLVPFCILCPIFAGALVIMAATSYGKFFDVLDTTKGEDFFLFIFVFVAMIFSSAYSWTLVSKVWS